MAVYMITYDLKAFEKRNYTGLYDAIKGYEHWCRPFEAVWFVDTVTKSEADISMELKPHLQSENGDTLLVIRVIQERSGYYSAKCVDWMQSDSRTWRTPAVR
ncbi:conserved hypothetical protein [Gluconacetobacter diazotrophicus PA1 5]|uniref:Uncharacterized protein n=2 Tax=Gluconacetobacter diazotrophicus TaxID=33996 RepID=A9H4U3_GLUDA|nr:hypothetical protein [Gluconacetobacter diazotrophicus]ACI52501.1 conserved hypothetical protein [Gluconacetobacter diazotrophicus PA1 5]MBB2156771.1 hypothetical protein [Gluconacetobacter diazotrophicus]TWB03112.1 hypothetical protein FBZ86_12223 [Gluconacetobacter diazotrophicus]CAP57484.1 hypothetical protein GDI3541 [Gluconacetobacter diazotrophicus PA1 5]